MTNHGRGSWIEHWENMDIWAAFFQPYFDVLGESVFALLIFGVLLLGMYSWTESKGLTGIIAVLFAGVAVAALPPPAARVVVIFATLMLGIALYAVWGRR